MTLLGPYRALDATLSIRTHRALADAVDDALADLRTDDRAHEMLVARRTRRAAWTIRWRSSSRAGQPGLTGPTSEPIAGNDAALAELLATVNGAAAMSVAGRMSVLHGGAVVLGGRGVAFIGAADSGTSSLTAAATSAGHGYLTDGVTAIDPDGRLRSFHAPIRLHAETAAELGVTIPPGPFATTYPLRVGAFATLAPDHRLDTVVVVSRGTGSSIEPLDPADALVELSHHTIATGGFDTAMFRRLETIVRTVPVQRLELRDPHEALALVTSTVA